MKKFNLHKNKNTLQQVFALHEKKDLTIDCVLEGAMCNVFVDNDTDPTVFLIQNGESYILGGDVTHSAADEVIDIIPTGAIILPSPLDWMEKLQVKTNLSLQKLDRFSLNHENILTINLDNIIISKPSCLSIKKIDSKLAKDISKDQNFKSHFQNFESEADFLQRGVGFVAIKEGKVIGVASSALVCANGYEINIMVLPEFRGQGFGKALAASLVKEILIRKKIPHWDADNMISLNLATQLGYDFTDKYYVQKVVGL